MSGIQGLPGFTTFWGTPDYYNYCATTQVQPPNTFQGTCNPWNGNAMMGIAMFNQSYPNAGREYLHTPLNCPMVSGKTYTLSFWITNGTTPISPWTIKNVGVHFSTSALTQTSHNVILLNPTCEVTTMVASTTWQQYTFIVTPPANTTWNHITIGNFRNDNQNSPTKTYSVPHGNPAAYAYYFIDSITVIKPSSGSAFVLNSSITQPLCGAIASASVSTSPSTPVSYLWSPGGWTTASVSNLAPGVYTVMAYTNNGCNSDTTYTQIVIKQPTFPPTLTVNPTALCAGQVTLTASGASTYTWLPSNSTGNTLVVNPPVTSSYTVIGTAANGCTASTTFTVPIGSTNVSVNSVTFCTNSSITATLIANSTFTTGLLTFTWAPGSLTGQTVYVSPVVNTIYTVTALSPAGCPTSATLAVTITTNCCSQPTTGLTLLTGGLSGTYPNTSYFITSNISLNNSTTFQNSEVLMMPGVQITVPSGKVLSLDHAHLYACGSNMWQGIVVQDGGQIITSNIRKESSLIEDAEVAIDVDNISTAHINPPIMIDNVIFNRNHVGIKLSNALLPVINLPVGITECVFSSRTLTFTSPAPFTSVSWPSSDVSSTGLRYAAAGATAGIVPPYLLQGFAQSNTKLPHSSQPSHIGIKIENIGNQPTVLPTTGVDINITYQGSAANGGYSFNLFDGHEIGIDVLDASLTTMNNVFQNAKQYIENSQLQAGKGINHLVTGQMNAQLDLRPVGASNQATDFGNRFWNCWTAVKTRDVYDVNIEYGIFRSNRNLSTGWGPGSIGIIMESNRFNYNIQKSEFNNLEFGIWVNTNNGPYDVNGTVGGDTYAGNMTMNQNYFGPEVTSLTSISSEYLGSAITINGNTAPQPWNLMGVGNIFSNKIDRAYRGIRVNQTDRYAMEIGGNNIKINDDFVPGNDQYGIYVNDSQDNLQINQNNVTGPGVSMPWNQNVRLIRSIRNTGQNSPHVECNNVYDGYIGFEFDGQQPNTYWHGNTMYQKMYKGLSLVNNGAIGMQGNPGQACADRWNDNGNVAPDDWASNWYTYVDMFSNASPGSFLWCEGAPFNGPATNGFTSPGTPFAYGPSVADVGPGAGADCTNPNVYPSLPTQRGTNGNVTGITKPGNSVSNWGVQIFPNPTNGNLNIVSSTAHEPLDVRIVDLNGKVVYSERLSAGGSASLDLSALPVALYIIEIQNTEHKTVHSKLVKTQ